MLKLIKPSKEYYSQYKEMMDEWNMEGSRISPWILQLKYHTEKLFNELLDRVNEVEKGENLGEYATSTTYWLYEDEENKLLGASNLRHYLTDDGLKLWGHIGYGIRPSERNKGYATELLKMTLEEAKASGAIGLFEKKYGDKVKVYSIGDFSKEICGGPHVEHTGVLGTFKIKKEEASSAGIRRIKAILIKD